MKNTITTLIAGLLAILFSIGALGAPAKEKPLNWSLTNLPWMQDLSYEENIVRAFQTDVSQYVIDRWTDGFDWSIISSNGSSALIGLVKSYIKDYDKNVDYYAPLEKQPSTVQLRAQWLRNISARPQAMLIPGFVKMFLRYPFSDDQPILAAYVFDFSQWKLDADYAKWIRSHFNRPETLKTFFAFIYPTISSDQDSRQVLQQIVANISPDLRAQLIADLPLEGKIDLSTILEGLSLTDDLVLLQNILNRLDLVLTSEAEENIPAYNAQEYALIHYRIHRKLKDSFSYGLDPHHDANLDYFFKTEGPSGWTLIHYDQATYPSLSMDFASAPYARALIQLMMSTRDLDDLNLLLKYAQKIDWVTPGSPGYKHFDEAVNALKNKVACPDMYYKQCYPLPPVLDVQMQAVLVRMLRIPATMNHPQLLRDAIYTWPPKNILAALVECRTCVVSDQFDNWMDMARKHPLFFETPEISKMLETLRQRRSKAERYGLVRSQMGL